MAAGNEGRAARAAGENVWGNETKSPSPAKQATQGLGPEIGEWRGRMGQIGARGLGRILRPLALAAIVALAGALVLGGFANPRHLADALLSGKGWARDHLIGAALGYGGLYVAFAALSLPGAWALSLAGGAVFGPWIGIPLVSVSSTIGATAAMLISRYILRDWVAARFPEFVRRVDGGVARDGARFLFAARLTPVIPFFAINLAMGLTRMPARVFAAITLLGALPFVFVYVLAGVQVSSIERPSDILSVRVVIALLALAFAPFAFEAVAAGRRRRKALADWNRPKAFDYNLIVIGAGSAGLVAAYVAAAAKARVLLIEEAAMGGDCLNTGCVPSKALIRSAKLAHEGREAEAFGLEGALEPDFAAVMRRVHRVIGEVAPHDSAERYRGLGAEVQAGRAHVVDPWTVEVERRRFTTRRIVVATGAEPILPPIPGLNAVEPLTSETLWSLTEAPKRLLVVGGGAIGCELAQSFQRLGSATVLVEGAPRVIPREDEEVSVAMRAALAADGVEIFEGVGVASFAPSRTGYLARLSDGREIEFDRVIVAIGRRPRTRGFGLEELGLLEDGKLVVDERLRTRLPTIFAAGDVLGQLQFTHAAGQYGVFAAMHALLGPLKPGRARLPAFPMAIYTDPEIARVGLNESEARERGVNYEVTRYDLAELDRAIADGAARGFVKALTTPGRDRILGVTIVGARAGEMLGEFTLAMRHNLGLGAILSTIHPYPGWNDAARAVAGEWRRTHAPGWALEASRRIFSWLRG